MDGEGQDTIRDEEALALHPACCLHHLQPRLCRSNKLRLRRSSGAGPDPPHQRLPVRAPRRALLSWILPLSNSRRSLRPTQKRPTPHLFRSCELGHSRLSHRSGSELLAPRHRSHAAWSGRELHPSGDADPSHQLVHPLRTLPHQHDPAPRQSGHPDMDVRRHRLSHPVTRLADDVHRRRPALDPLGLHLARRHSRQTRPTPPG